MFDWRVGEKFHASNHDLNPYQAGRGNWKKINDDYVYLMTYLGRTKNKIDFLLFIASL